MTSRSYARLSVAVCALVLAASPAFAHSHPVKMAPDKDATVGAPKEISIEFSEALDPKLSTLELDDDKGVAVSKATAVLDPSDAKHLTLALPALAPGVYSVKWVSVATDAHRLNGTYSFTVK